MEFNDIVESVERFLPIYLKARGIDFEMKKTKNSLKCIISFEGKRYIIETRELK